MTQSIRDSKDGCTQTEYDQTKYLQAAFDDAVSDGMEALGLGVRHRSMWICKAPGIM
jgi:hypothetical protein